MIVDGQCYIVIAPGMERPEDAPERVEYFNTHSNQWTQRTFSGTLGKYDTYRYPVTEAEYKAHHWCIAHGDEMPEGQEVLRFGRPIPGDIVMCPGGRLYTYRVGDSWVNGLAPILRKKPCEHKSTKIVCENASEWEKTYVHCNDCGMVRKLGDWE